MLVPAVDAEVSNAQAQSPQVLPSISVEGDRIAGSVRSALQARHDAPNAIVVIDGEQLNQFNDMSIGDAIRRLPGVTFPGVNRSREIKLRGLPGEYTQVLLDGRPLVDADTSRSNMEVDRIPASMIERVEIIRSPLVKYPSSGAAGTVNIITKRNFAPTGNVGLTIGGGHVDSFNNPGELSAWIGGEAGQLKYFIGGGYQRRYLEESINTFNTVNPPSNEGKNIQDQKRTFDEWTFLSRFEYRANENNSFVWSPTYMKTTELREQTDWRYSAAGALNRTREETRNRLRENIGNLFEWNQAFNNFFSGRVFFDVQQAKEETWRRPKENGVPGAPTFNPIDLMRYAPGAAYTALIGDHTVEFGGGLNQITRDEKDTTRTDRFYSIKESIYYGYLSDSFSIFGRDRLTAGVRMEHAILDTTDVNGMTRSTTATDWNPSLQYRLSLTDDVDFRAGLARTLRRPDMRELSPIIRTVSGNTYANPDTQGNPDLVPERIWGLDVGMDWYLFDRLGLFSVNYFNRQFSDKIERSIRQESGRYISTPRNLGDGEAYGVELEARVPLKMFGMPNLTLWGNLTNIHSSVNDPLTGQTRRFAEQPDLLTNVGLDYYVEAWKTTFGVNWNRVYAYSQDILQVASATTTQNVHTDFNTLDKLDFSVKTVVSKNMTLSFSALNVLRPIDRRTMATYTPAGALSTVQLTEQASHSTYYVRANFIW